MVTMRKLSRGAEATIYLTKIFGKEAVVKIRESKGYRVRVLDERIRYYRTRSEARTIFRAMAAGVPVPTLFGVARFSICMEKLEGVLLKDSRITPRQMRYAGAILSLLHNSNIVHGDFTPANLIAKGGKLHVIDFGLSESSNSYEDKAVDLLLMKRAVSGPLYKHFSDSYFSSSRSSKAVLARLSEIELRGRYRLRTLGPATPGKSSGNQRSQTPQRQG